MNEVSNNISAESDSIYWVINMWSFSKKEGKDLILSLFLIFLSSKPYIRHILDLYSKINIKRCYPRAVLVNEVIEQTTHE